MDKVAVVIDKYEAITMPLKTFNSYVFQISGCVVPDVRCLSHILADCLCCSSAYVGFSQVSQLQAVEWFPLTLKPSTELCLFILFDCEIDMWRMRRCHKCISPITPKYFPSTAKLTPVILETSGSTVVAAVTNRWHPIQINRHVPSMECDRNHHGHDKHTSRFQNER